MKIASNIITRMKTTFNRDITDPRQREMILGDTLKQFAKKMDMAQDNDAYSLLDQLAMEYESIKIDPMEIYYKAFELYQNEKRLLQTIVGFLRSRDAKDKKAIHYYQKLSNAEPENFQMLALLVECYKENNESVPLMMTYERIIKKFRELEESRRWARIWTGIGHSSNRNIRIRCSVLAIFTPRWANPMRTPFPFIGR